MEAVLKILHGLPLADWCALTLFFAAWVGYAWFAQRRAHKHPSILASTNRIRHAWMLQTTHREGRTLDGLVTQALSSGPSFFASTTILIIGGLLAALGAGEKTSELVRDLPFAASTSESVFDLKLALLLVIFVYAFFRFTWSMRQNIFCALLLASAPEAQQFSEQNLSRDEFADRAGRVVGLAAETFNDGLRAYYMAFAALGWLFSPLVFMLATAVVIFILYQREFHSEVLKALNS